VGPEPNRIENTTANTTTCPKRRC